MNTKRLFLSLIAIMATAMVTYAQQVATLTHDKTITAYYGGSALTEALKVAVDGDVITLSDGVFDVTTIDKAVSIIGAGMEYVNGKHTKRTTLACSSKSYITIAVDGVLNVMNVNFMQGLYLQKVLSSSNFVKCRFNGTTFYNSSGLANCKNVTFLQCRMSYLYHKSGDIAFYQNCLIEAGTDYDHFSIARGSSISFVNSTIQAAFYYCHTGTFVNSVLCYSGASTSYHTISSGNTCSATNCLNFVKSGSNNILGNVQRTNCYSYASKWMFKDDSFYELTDEAKAAVSSSDGTEVGMYGGVYPYDPIPEGPRITKFNVAKSSDTENKLNVEVEVTNGNTTSE